MLCMSMKMKLAQKMKPIKMRVLIVDDEPSTSRDFENSIGALFSEVYSAKDLDEAFRVLKLFKITHLLMNIRMDVSGSYERKMSFGEKRCYPSVVAGIRWKEEYSLSKIVLFEKDEIEHCKLPKEIDEYVHISEVHELFKSWLGA